MARGFEREDAENQPRAAENQLCEGYACVELATVVVGRNAYCAAHAPPTAQPATVEPESA